MTDSNIFTFAVVCLFWWLLFPTLSCKTTILPVTNAKSELHSGSTWYQAAATATWQQRDSMAVEYILAGNMPGFLKKLVPVTTRLYDTASQQNVTATFYVTPDYLSVGTDADWARVCITPMAAQRIADSLQCFLPTRKMVDAIYKAAKVQLEPQPLTAHRDSTPTFYQHHLLIEAQRKGRKGLIAGIKKDIVVSSQLLRHAKRDRVAIYGWHKTDGKPIQPLYTGHVNWYVDYSHGVRLVSRRVQINGRWVHYTEVLAHPVWKQLLCDEADCSVVRY